MLVTENRRGQPSWPLHESDQSSNALFGDRQLKAYSDKTRSNAIYLVMGSVNVITVLNLRSGDLV